MNTLSFAVVTIAAAASPVHARAHAAPVYTDAQPATTRGLQIGANESSKASLQARRQLQTTTTCADSSTWYVGSTSQTCSWFSASSGRCSSLPDYNQKDACPVACSTCWPSGTSTSFTMSGWFADATGRHELSYKRQISGIAAEGRHAECGMPRGVGCVHTPGYDRVVTDSTYVSHSQPSTCSGSTCTAKTPASISPSTTGMSEIDIARSSNEDWQLHLEAPTASWQPLYSLLQSKGGTIAWADFFGGDGLPDVVMLYNGELAATTNTVWENKGNDFTQLYFTSSPSLTSNFGSSNRARHIAVADYNNDGRAPTAHRTEGLSAWLHARQYQRMRRPPAHELWFAVWRSRSRPVRLMPWLKRAERQRPLHQHGLEELHAAVVQLAPVSRLGVFKLGGLGRLQCAKPDCPLHAHRTTLARTELAGQRAEFSHIPIHVRRQRRTSRPLRRKRWRLLGQRASVRRQLSLQERGERLPQGDFRRRRD